MAKKPQTTWYCVCRGKDVVGLWERECTACQITVPFANRIETDRRVTAERQWHKATIARKPQKPCDHGLFSDEASQLDLVEMLQDPTD